MKISISKVREGYKVLPEPGTKDTENQVFNKSLGVIAKNPMKVTDIARKGTGLTKAQKVIFDGVTERIELLNSIASDMLNQLRGATGKDLRAQLSAKDLDMLKTLASLGVKSTANSDKFLTTLTKSRVVKYTKLLNSLSALSDDKELTKTFKALIKFFDTFEVKIKTLGTKASRLKSIFSETMVKEVASYKEEALKDKAFRVLVRNNNKDLGELIKSSSTLATAKQIEMFSKIAQRMRAADADIPKFKAMVSTLLSKLKPARAEDKKILASMRKLARYTKPLGNIPPVVKAVEGSSDKGFVRGAVPSTKQKYAKDDEVGEWMQKEMGIKISDARYLFISIEGKTLRSGKVLVKLNDNRTRSASLKSLMEAVAVGDNSTSPINELKIYAKKLGGQVDSSIAKVYTQIMQREVTGTRRDASAPKRGARDLKEDASHAAIRKNIFDPISATANFPYSTLRNSSPRGTKGDVKVFIMSATSLGKENLDKAQAAIFGMGFLEKDLDTIVEGARGLLYSHKTEDVTLFVGRNSKTNRSIIQVKGDLPALEKRFKRRGAGFIAVPNPNRIRAK